MEISTHNPNGGPVLGKSFRLHPDPITGRLGYLIGYLPNGEKVVCPYQRIREVAEVFAAEVLSVDKWIKKCTPKPTLKEKITPWILRWLGQTPHIDEPKLHFPSEGFYRN